MTNLEDIEAYGARVEVDIRVETGSVELDLGWHVGVIRREVDGDAEDKVGVDLVQSDGVDECGWGGWSNGLDNVIDQEKRRVLCLGRLQGSQPIRRGSSLIWGTRTGWRSRVRSKWTRLQYIKQNVRCQERRTSGCMVGKLVIHV